MTDPITTDLSMLLDDIRRLFNQEDEFRIEAGKKLIEAKKLVENGEAGEMKWQDWVEAKIDRSYRDVQRCIKIASDPDPKAALGRERGKARNGMAKSRAKKKTEDDATNVSLPAAKKQVRKLLDEHKLWTWVVQEGAAKIRPEPETPLVEETNAMAAYRRGETKVTRAA